MDAMLWCKTEKEKVNVRHKRISKSFQIDGRRFSERRSGFLIKKKNLALRKGLKHEV